MFCFLGAHAQKGLVINGGYIVFGNASGSAPYIYVMKSTGNTSDLSTDCDFTNQTANSTNGQIKSTGIGGTLSIEGDWNNKCNNGVFSSDGITVVLNGTNTQDIGPTSGSGGYTSKFYNLTLGGTGTKYLQTDTWVGGVSTLSGTLNIASRTLDLNQYTLTIKNPNGSAITRSTGYIVSETSSATNPSIISWEMGTNTGSHIFPFGVSGDYIPFTFDKVSTSSSTISVSTRATSTSYNTPWSSTVTTMNKNGVDGSVDYVIDRWWDISSSLNPLTGGANLTFSYRGAENTITSNPTGTISSQHWNGATWDAKQGTGSGVQGANIGTCTASGQTSFSPYILVADDNPLPIELLNFSANCNGNHADISWSTTAESLNEYYTIEKSYDGHHYEEVTTVNSKGSFSKINTYQISDGETLSGNCYYRLSQIDHTGNKRFLGTVASNCGPKDFEIVNIFNKNNTELNFNYRIEDEESFVFEFYNSIGQQIITYPYKSIKGLNEVTFDISKLSYGMYFLVMKNSNHTFSRKVLITR